MKTSPSRPDWFSPLRRLFSAIPSSRLPWNWFARSMSRKMGGGLLVMLSMMAIAIVGSMVQVRWQSSDATLIRMAGRQQVLGQEIAKESLNIQNGDASASQRLAEAVDEYTVFLHILIEGDPAQEILPATPAARAELARVEDLWRPMLLSVNHLGRNAANVSAFYDAIAAISTQIAPVMASFQGISAPLGTADGAEKIAALLGDQAVLLQKATTYALEISQGRVESAANFSAAADTFGRNLNWLLDGYPAGQIPAASEPLRGQLLQLRRQWQPVSDAVDILSLNSSHVTGIAGHIDLIVENSGYLLAQGDKVVAVLEAEAQAKTARMLAFLQGLGALFLLVFLAATWMVRRSIRLMQRMTALSATVASAELPALRRALDQLADGDLTAQVSINSTQIAHVSSDEMGQMAAMFNAMIEQLQQAAAAFNASMATLRELVGSVQESSNSIAHFSYQLNDAAVQSGAATQQIAQVIGHAAQGNMAQLNRVQDVHGTIEDQAHWVEQIADGAARQKRATTEARRLLQEELAQATAQAQNTANSGDMAARSADRTVSAGVKTVEKTIAGMRAIAASTDDVARRVQEMNESSRKIGTIVQTIDEIAERTNLLALNAAIEAARAGEHGRGFAVVADEVRKLAERAARSTNEISALIEGVQGTVTQSMEAMGTSRQRVQEGLATAVETDRSLVEIRQAVTEVIGQMHLLNQAVAAMGNSNAALGTVMEQVTAVGEENILSVRNLSQLSEQISLAMSEISSVSKENSVAAEEIFAGAEEVRAQMTETVTSVDLLASMADRLQGQVNHFHIHEQPSIPSTGDAPGLLFSHTQPRPRKQPLLAVQSAPPVAVGYTNGR